MSKIYPLAFNVNFEWIEHRWKLLFKWKKNSSNSTNDLKSLPRSQLHVQLGQLHWCVTKEANNKNAKSNVLDFMLKKSFRLKFTARNISLFQFIRDYLDVDLRSTKCDGSICFIFCLKYHRQFMWKMIENRTNFDEIEAKWSKYRIYLFFFYEKNLQ